MRDAVTRAMLPGLTRLIVADRAIPPPTLMLAAVLLVLVADPLLALARERRPALWAVILAGLVPLVPWRLGEAAMSWLVPLPGPTIPGLAVSLPREFEAGLDLFWRDAAPPAVEALSARLNAFSLWVVGLWAVGLRELDGTRLALWHVALPLACLAAAGLLTWLLEGAAVALILGTP
jgi:hypothetical protein